VQHPVEPEIVRVVVDARHQDAGAPEHDPPQTRAFQDSTGSSGALAEIVIAIAYRARFPAHRCKNRILGPFSLLGLLQDLVPQERFELPTPHYE